MFLKPLSFGVFHRVHRQQIGMLLHSFHVLYLCIVLSVSSQITLFHFQITAKLRNSFIDLFAVLLSITLELCNIWWRWKWHCQNAPKLKDPINGMENVKGAKTKENLEMLKGNPMAVKRQAKNNDTRCKWMQLVPFKVLETKYFLSSVSAENKRKFQINWIDRFIDTLHELSNHTSLMDESDR